MLNRILVLLYGKSGFFIQLRSLQKYNWNPSKNKFYLSKKIACQLSNYFLIFFFLHLDANKIKLLWSVPRQEKIEFLFPITILYYHSYFFPLHSSRPLQSSLTSPFMFPTKVETLSLWDFNHFTVAAAEDKFQQLLGYIFIYMKIGEITGLHRA